METIDTTIATPSPFVRSDNPTDPNFTYAGTVDLAWVRLHLPDMVLDLTTEEEVREYLRHRGAIVTRMEVAAECVKSGDEFESTADFLANYLLSDEGAGLHGSEAVEVVQRLLQKVLANDYRAVYE